MKHNCYSRDTEVLTENGFIAFADLKEGVKVAQVHNDDTLDFVNPIEIIKSTYTGDMYEFSDVNLLVTPEHRIAWRRHNDPQYYITTAEDFIPNDKSVFDFASKAIGTSHIITLIDSLKVIYAAGFIEKKDFRYVAYFNDITKLECFCLLLNSMYIQHDIFEKDENVWFVDFSIDTNLESDFSEYNLADKSSEWAQDFLGEFSFWPTDYTDDEYEEDSFCLSKYNAKITRFVQALASMAGFFSYETAGNKEYERDVYVSFSANKYISTEEIYVSIVKYTGNVYCVTVPTGHIVVRRKGTTVVCGNSSTIKNTSI